MSGRYSPGPPVPGMPLPPGFSYLGSGDRPPRPRSSGPPVPPPRYVRAQMAQQRQEVEWMPPPHIPQYPQHAPQQAPQGQSPFRVGEGIPASVKVRSKDDPRLVYEPMDGPLGFGIYVESEVDPEIIDFRPIIGGNSGGQAQHPAPTLQGQGRRGWKPTPFPFAPPPREPTPPPPDLIDPMWIEWWKDTTKIDCKTIIPWAQQSILEGRIYPLLDYISTIKGP